jgi:hypothetical protein
LGQPPERFFLEIKAQCDLAGAVACVFGCLRRGENTKGRLIVDLRRRWREVGVIEDIGEAGLEAELQVFANGKCLCCSEAHSNCSGALKATDARVSESPSTNRSGSEGGRIEVLLPRLVAIEITRYDVRSQKGRALSLLDWLAR